MLLMVFIGFIGLGVFILQLAKSVKNRNLRGCTILICLGLIVYGSFQVNKVENPTKPIQFTKTAQINKPKDPSIFDVGDTVKIDNFKYTLNNIIDNIIVIDSINRIIVNITAENIGKEASRLDRSMFKLKSFDGTIYNSLATLDDGSLFSDNMIPYVSITGSIAFEVPYKSTEMNYVLEIQGVLPGSETVDIKLY